MQIGVFGGAFNPIHKGHVNSLLQVQKQFNLDVIKVVPAYQSPGKDLIADPLPQERLKMAEVCLQDMGEHFEIDPCEMERKGISYTIDTLKNLKEKNPESDLHLIIGLDQFHSFDQWKEFEEIIKLAHLIVTSRPGFSFPLSKTSFPAGVQSLIEDFDGYQSITKTGKLIYFLKLNDIDISSSEIRKKIKVGQSVDKFLSLQVEKFIKDNNIYEASGPKIQDYKLLALEVAEFLESKKAINTLVFNFDKMSESIVDFAIICSATNKRQSVSLAESIIEKIKMKYSVRPIALDGMDDGRWVVMDYGSLIVHVFYDFVRQEYRLEQLWNKADKLEFKK
jgi:nicotinate-nucleotide adenylyltransferase